MKLKIIESILVRGVEIDHNDKSTKGPDKRGIECSKMKNKHAKECHIQVKVERMNK